MRRTPHLPLLATALLLTAVVPAPASIEFSNPFGEPGGSIKGEFSDGTPFEDANFLDLANLAFDLNFTGTFAASGKSGSGLIDGAGTYGVTADISFPPGPISSFTLSATTLSAFAFTPEANVAFFDLGVSGSYSLDFEVFTTYTITQLDVTATGDGAAELLEWGLTPLGVGDTLAPGVLYTIVLDASVGASYVYDPGDPFMSDLSNASIIIGAELPCGGADLDGDGAVAVPDLLWLLGAWGTNPGGGPDLNGDGIVNVVDLLTLIAAWGDC